MTVEQGVKSARRGDEIIATGRRKTAVARIRMRAGSGEITINGRDLDAYFPSIKDRALITGALGTGWSLRQRLTTTRCPLCRAM